MCQYRNDQATGFKGREQGMERDRAGKGKGQETGKREGGMRERGGKGKKGETRGWRDTDCPHGDC